MDMVGVAIPRTHLRHPRFIVIAFYPAEFLFYRSIDQDAFDVGLLGCCFDEGDIGSTPIFAIDVLPIHGNQVAGRDIIALFFAQDAIWHRHEPDINVEPNLMTLVSERKRATARLRHVTD